MRRAQALRVDGVAKQMWTKAMAGTGAGTKFGGFACACEALCFSSIVPCTLTL
jgi:hypothetical protein